MCNKSGSLQRPPYLRTRSMINKTTETTTSKSLKPARKSRTKTRKPKFLSLRLELSQQQKQQQQQQQTSTIPSNSSSNNDMSSSRHHHHHHHQLNLFPLHPENMVDDKLAADINDDNNVAFLFHSEGGGGATLNGLLTAATTATTTMSTEEDSISMSYAAAYRGGRECCSEESQSLVRTAMRNRERDISEEEKWVCYSEVVEKREVEEETSSSYCAGDGLWSQKRTTTQGLLSLKLDYEGILNAWSDKAPLYIHGESPQTVPDLQDDKSSNVLMDGLGSAENVWKVPESGGNASSLKMKEEMGGRESWKMGQREASVLRYKEKRQSRLFSKRIRYEVRKLNAEKRPRMKGRFVKRN